MSHFTPMHSDINISEYYIGLRMRILSRWAIYLAMHNYCNDCRWKNSGTTTIQWKSMGLGRRPLRGAGTGSCAVSKDSCSNRQTFHIRDNMFLSVYSGSLSKSLWVLCISKRYSPSASAAGLHYGKFVGICKTCSNLGLNCIIQP